MKYVALNKVDNDIIIRGDTCITTLRELYEALIDKDTTEIELRREFVDKNFTYDALCTFVEQSASIAPNVRLWVDGMLYDNTLAAVKEIKEYREPAEFVYAIEHDPTKLISTIQRLCKSYIEAHDEAAVASNRIATMLVEIDDLQKKLEDSKQDYASLQKVHCETESRLHTLVSRVNFKYEKTVKEDEMFLLSENQYNHILYIKEITRVHYTDTLLYYVEEILKTLYSAPVRSVVIEPYYSYGVERLYPNYAPHWNLTYKDVYSGDILMAGFQPKVMKDILQDSNHLNYLVILDRGGYRVPHVTGSNVDVIYTVSDTKDIPTGVLPSRVISYSEDTMYIPYIEGFDSLSPEEKIQKYSSMDITKKLINILEEVN